MKRALVLFSLMSFSIILNAKSLHDRRFLPGCTEVGHEFISNNLAIKPIFKTVENQGIFFIHNISSFSLNIKLTPTKATAQYPAWQRTIDPDNWGAFATDKDFINLSCYQYDDLDSDRTVNCQEVLEVCQYVNAEFGRQNQGNYWVADNLSRIDARDHVIRSGILLRW